MEVLTELGVSSTDCDDGFSPCSPGASGNALGCPYIISILSWSVIERKMSASKKFSRYILGYERDSSELDPVTSEINTNQYCIY